MGATVSGVRGGAASATFVYDGDGNGGRDMDAVHRTAWSSSSSATARRASEDTGDERLKD